MAEAFRADAEALVTGLKPKSGTVVDAVAEITRPFVYKVLPDLLGIPVPGREHMYAFGNMVWATMGPMNELFAEAMQDTGSGDRMGHRAAAAARISMPDGLGMQMFLAADRGEITQDEAKLLVGILLSAAADTTIITMANAIRAFSIYPEQYQLVRRESVPGARGVRREPALGFALAHGRPHRHADVEIDGVVIPQGERCGLMFAAANRDPRKWTDPDRFDVQRDNRGHVGWGYGVHSCVGRVLAGLEADALLGAIVTTHRALRARRRARALDDYHRSRSGEAARQFFAAGNEQAGAVSLGAGRAAELQFRRGLLRPQHASTS